MHLEAISEFKPRSKARAWLSVPHPTLPLVATASSDKSVRIYSLQNFQLHSTLDGGHKRSIRTVAWKPNLPKGTLGLVTGSFDATAGVWRRSESQLDGDDDENSKEDDDSHDWDFSLVLEGHDSEIKSIAFSPSGQYLATCSRDKSVWIWEEVGSEGEDEWETVAVLQDHEGDVKSVSWCHDDRNGDILASASYDDTVRLYREDEEREWGCVAVLAGHEGTVWSLDWEPTSYPRRSALLFNPAPQVKSQSLSPESESVELDSPPPPRLLSSSADLTIRIWQPSSPHPSKAPSSSNGIPSTMRPAPSGEIWTCTATLPAAHSRPIYSISWSAKTGRIVSTGSDSKIVVYEERLSSSSSSPPPQSSISHTIQNTDNGEKKLGEEERESPKTEWHILTILDKAHGPYEVNHVAWSGRFDRGKSGVEGEEMLVSTGDDGVVRAWAIVE